jgi:hypothetical protein
MSTKAKAETVFDLTVVDLNGEPMVLDLDLARVLEFERQRDIRKLIKRLLKEGILSDSDICATVARGLDKLGRGRTAIAFSLTQTGALLVTTRSDTKRAHIITRGIVSVFESHLRKTLPANDNGVSAAELAAVQKKLIALQVEVALLRDGYISGTTLAQLRADVRRIAGLEVAARRWLTPGAARADIYRELRELTGWGGRGQPWHLAPAGLAHPANVVLRGRDASIQRELKLLAADRQMRLPEVPLEPEVPPKKETTH